MSLLDMRINSIFFGCFLGFFSFILFCLTVIGKEKMKKAIYAALCFLSFSIAVLMVSSGFFNSEKLAFSVIVPFGVSIAVFTVSYCNTYKKCNTEVTAILKEYRIYRRSIPTVYMPLFSYEYGGKIYEAYDLQFYYKRRFFDLFVVGKQYAIFIDPKDPNICCVYKQAKNYVIIFGYLLSAVITICGVIVVIAV